MSGDALVLTIDGGGSSVKVAVFSLVTGRSVGQVRHEYAPLFRRPGWTEFDPGAWWSVIAGACREVVDRVGASAREYVGLTCTGMRAAFVLVDRDGEAVSPGVLVPDRRGAAYVGQIADEVGGTELYARTGHWLSSRFVLPKLLWFAREAPTILSAARHVLQFHDWLVLRLSGTAVSEPSSASMSQLLDVGRRHWASDVLATLGLAEEQLPPLVDAGTRVGGLLPGAASAIGLRAGTPVHAGGGDTHVGALGATAVEPGSIAVVAGSTTPAQLTVDRYRAEPGPAAPLISAHLRPGQYARETNAGETGVIYRWASELAAVGADPEELDRLARTAPIGSAGLLVTAARPHWGPEPWSRVAPITLFGVRPEYPPAHMLRAATECAAYATAAAVQVLLAERAPRPTRICALGGATRSLLWAQVLADVLGNEIEVSTVEHPAARAGAELVCPDAVIPTTEPESVRTVTPEPGHHEPYVALADRYATVFAALDAAFGEPA